MAKRKHDQARSKGALLRLPEEIIDTYGLYATKGARKATLIGRPLPNGNVALYIYAYANGRKQQQGTGVVLKPEGSLETKNENKEKIRLQGIRVDELNARLEREGVGFVPMKKQKEKPLTLVGYGEKLLADDDLSKGRRYELTACLRRIKEYEGNRETLLTNINEDWVRGFLAYLRSARSNRHKNMQAPHLQENTVLAMFTQLVIILNSAVRERLIGYNPAAGIERKEKPHYQGDRRVYLTQDEVERLTETPYPCDGWDVDKAFLFSCFTGLRFSDLKSLTTNNIERDGDDIYVVFRAQKTGKAQRLKVGAMALRYLPMGRESGKLLFVLPSNAVANQKLSRWVAAAGISKKVSFHVARHTAATLLLSAGCSLETVAYQLGHSNLATTQIYAKITDKAQAAAMDTLDRLFGQGGTPGGTATKK